MSQPLRHVGDVLTCCRCKRDLPAERFNRHSSKTCGRSYACKDCVNAQQSARYRENLEVSRARRRMYFNRSKTRQRIDPIKHAAHQTVQRALKRGQLVRPDSCSRCGERHRIEAHHDDYGKPLEVLWLCTMCHRKRPKELASNAA